MTVERRMIIKCDGRCKTELSFPMGMLTTAGRARTYLASIGWVHIKKEDKDYCPDCKVKP